MVNRNLLVWPRRSQIIWRAGMHAYCALEGAPFGVHAWASPQAGMDHELARDATQPQGHALRMALKIEWSGRLVCRKLDRPFG